MIRGEDISLRTLDLISKDILISHSARLSGRSHQSVMSVTFIMIITDLLYRILSMSLCSAYKNMAAAIALVVRSLRQEGCIYACNFHVPYFGSRNNKDPYISIYAAGQAMYPSSASLRKGGFPYQPFLPINTEWGQCGAQGADIPTYHPATGKTGLNQVTVLCGWWAEDVSWRCHMSLPITITQLSSIVSAVLPPAAEDVLAEIRWLLFACMNSTRTMRKICNGSQTRNC